VSGAEPRTAALNPSVLLSLFEKIRQIIDLNKILNMSSQPQNEAEQLIQEALETNSPDLDLAGLELTELPESIAQLTNLQTLDLSFNQLTSLPEGIGKLTNLQRLYLGFNQLTSLPKSVIHLSNLKELCLNVNKLTSLPEVVVYLSNLQTLDLVQNQLTSLPEAITHLINLQTLYLASNQLTSLPEGMQQLTQLEELYLHGNENLSLPPEMLGPEWYEKESNQATVQKILDYYYRTRQGKKRPLNEAKLIFVGYGTVGKTSLVNRLVHDNFDKDSSKTEGIQITQ
jgi:internalin A